MRLQMPLLRVLPEHGRTMSYDVYLESAINPDDEIYWGNYTSNVGHMWRAAGIDIRSYDGQLGNVVSPQLVAGITELAHNSETYSAMNPENGWGSYETGLVFLCEVLVACLQNPAAAVRVRS